MFAKYLKWEFWPAIIFYQPIFCYYLFLSLKARSFTFFTASNPSQYLGGMAMANKYQILKRFDERLIPKTILVKLFDHIDVIEKELVKHEMNFPIIAKPNFGERGKQVSIIENKKKLKNYLQHVKKEIILQEFIDYPIELGILYYRYPNEKNGHISSIVKKGFLQITGDGVSTFSELIKNGDRTKYYLKSIRERFSKELERVPEKSKTIILQKIGNHNKGTAFYNANEFISTELIKVFDKISEQQNEFYFGRYDIKCKSIEQLYKGEGIKIMELNGANSEPAHIYDPNMPLMQAYKDLITHWKTIYKISVLNNKQGIKYMPFFRSLTDIIRYNLKKNQAFKPD